MWESGLRGPLAITLTPGVIAVIYAMATIVCAYALLKFVKYSLNKLVAKNVIGQSAAEQVYKPVALLAYVYAFTAAIYFVTGASYMPYLWIALALVLLLANWTTLADVMAYYVLLSKRIRVGDVVELKRYGIKGRILSMSLTSTTIKTRRGETVMVPNHVLLSEPLARSSQEPLPVILEIELHPSEPRYKVPTLLDDVESRIRSTLTQRKAGFKPHEVLIALKEFAGGRAIFDVVVTLPSVQMRYSAVNAIVALLAEALREYNPTIRVASFEV